MHTLEAIADRGYFSSPEILACHEAGITVTLPKPLTSGAKSDGRFGKQDFVYIAEEDVYRCPAGERLAYRYTNEEAGQSSAALLDHRVLQVSAQIAMHDRTGATHHAMGARTVARGGTAASRRKPASHAPTARDGRASVRHDEGAHGCDALPHKDAAESCRRDGAECARLQSDTRHEHHRRQAADGSKRRP